MSKAPETIFVDALRPGGRSVAVAVADGAIASSGDPQAVRALAGPSTTIVALDRGVVVPGFHDAHLHLSAGALSWSRIDLRGLDSVEAVAGTVARAATEAPGGSWIRGEGWDHTLWNPAVWPTRASLDAVLPNQPAFLQRIDGHVAWVNSEALRRLGIDGDTPDPPGGTIARDPSTLEPTGVLTERAADLALARLPAETASERMIGLRRGLDLLRRHGVTSIEDVAEPWAVPLYARLRERGELTARVSVWLPLGLDEDEAQTLRRQNPAGDPYLSVATRKVFLDGTLGSRTAALRRPYADAPGERGALRVAPDALVAAVAAADEAGWAVAFHAVGDRAVSQALDTVETLPPRARARPHRIEHAQVVGVGDLPRFAALGVVASIQPVHLASDARWLDRRVRRSEESRLYPWRSLLRSGALVAMGTDWPVEEIDPLRGIAAAARRRTVGERDESLTVAAALDAYTRGSALAAGDSSRGCLRPGGRADLVVLSEDPTAMAPDAIEERVRVTRTVVAGRTVFNANGSV
jgi:predicted amidohydrolase YtcJ